MSFFNGSKSTLIGVEVRGTEKLQKLFESVQAPAFMEAVAQAVYAEANVIMLEAKREVPLDDGPLRRSGTVVAPVITGWKWWIALGFGGAASAYALLQHENLLFKHLPGRKAKYLEDPVNERLPIMEKNMAARIEKYLNASG